MKFTFSFTHISTNTLALTSVERLILIYLPLRSKDVCNLQVARRVIFSLLLIFTLFELHLFFTINFENDSGRLACVTISSSYSQIFHVLDSVLYSYLPLTVMLACNIAIVLKLLLAKYKKTTDNNEIGNMSLSKAAKGITVMLISVSVLFVICTLPYAVIYQVQIDVSTYSYAVIILLMYTNHSVNIIVYSFTNKQFKKEMQRMLYCSFNSSRVMPFGIGESTWFRFHSHLLKLRLNFFKYFVTENFRINLLIRLSP